MMDGAYSTSEELRNAYKFFAGNLSLGIPCRKWEDNIKINLK
jgi:hypothetical protein